MNRKGFTLVEMLASMALLGVVLGIGLFVTKDTLATTFSTLTGVSTKEIFDASRVYILEQKTNWINDGEEYTCITVKDLVDKGYFTEEDILLYKNDIIKIIRNPQSRVIDSIGFVDVCE